MEAARIYDERFCRMWDFYLTSCEAAFRSGSMMVFQIQVTKNLQAAPLTRDYMVAAEAAFFARCHPRTPRLLASTTAVEDRKADTFREILASD